MADAAKKVAKKAAAKKNPLEDLRKAVKALRDAGYTVDGRVSRLTDEGVSEGENL